ncbi:hypothetical protein [Novosphingobium colocasiae]
MATVIALARHHAAPAPDVDWLRTLIVCGCAMALICAKAALPF